MTTGSALYLLMSIIMFVAFAAVLAFQSWQQSRVGPETVLQRADYHQDEHHESAA